MIGATSLRRHVAAWWRRSLLLVVPLLTVCFYLGRADSAEVSLGDDPNIRISYYEIEGNTIEELRQALLTRGPIDEKGVRRFAYTRWFISWRWPHLDGAAVLSRATAAYKIDIFVPQWNEPRGASTEVRMRWSSFIAALLAHEKNHVEFARHNFAHIAELIQQAATSNPKLSEDQAEQIAQRELSRIRMLDWSYDTDTNHGKLEGVVL